MAKNPNDAPWQEVIDSAVDHVNHGHAVFQKFSCCICDARLTIDEPNTFYTHATCDRCGSSTDIRAQGHNYMLINKAGADKLFPMRPTRVLVKIVP